MAQQTNLRLAQLHPYTLLHSLLDLIRRQSAIVIYVMLLEDLANILVEFA